MYEIMRARLSGYMHARAFARPNTLDSTTMLHKLTLPPSLRPFPAHPAHPAYPASNPKHNLSLSPNAKP